MQFAIESLAVLPLENLSSDTSQGYFADGMTESLITELAKIRALRVMSRPSVMQYKGARKPLPEIARELKVDAVLAGSVVRSGERVRITVQLIHAATDRNLWADSYERDLRDVLALQKEVTRNIVGEIRISLRRRSNCNSVASVPSTRKPMITIFADGFISTAKPKMIMRPLSRRWSVPRAQTLPLPRPMPNWPKRTHGSCFVCPG